MAVQAQYPPSNILLLNNNSNSKEDYDYDCSYTPAEALLHQSHVLFTNRGITNLGKRSRESKPPIAVAQAAPNVMNSVSLQSPQLRQLSQLHNHQHNSVSTGLRLSSFADQQRLQLSRHQPQQQSSQHGSHYSNLSALSSQDFVSQIKQHRDEIDQFLRAQEAELHRTLAEKRQRHYRQLLTTAEETVARRLREKDLEVEKVTRMNAELQARAAQLTAEAQLWQAKAKAQEATAASLQAQLQHAMMNGTALETRDEGGLSCAAPGADDAESAYIDPDRVEPTGPKCRGCGKRAASVVVLPCRHLCMCPKCDGHFRACPVCLSLKDSTVEVFLT